MSDIKFPAALRKMWSGQEVQDWLDNMNERVDKIKQENEALKAEVKDCSPYLKKDESILDCIERHRAETISSTGWWADERKLNEQLKSEIAALEKINYELQLQNNLLMEKQTKTNGGTTVRNAVTGKEIDLKKVCE